MCGELGPCFFPVTVSVIVYDKLIVKLKVKLALLAVSTLINQCFTLNFLILLTDSQTSSEFALATEGCQPCVFPNEGPHSAR